MPPLTVQRLNEQGVPAVEKSVTTHGRTIRYVEVPGPGATPILMIHGSPGSWDAWGPYLTARELAGYGPRIAMDRPGFGGSGPGDVVTDLRLQAAMLADLIPAGTRAVVVGHSLGGPLAAWIALDHPEKVCGVVMVAGSVVPEYERPRWYNGVARTVPVRWILPKELLWSNREMMPLADELRALEPKWEQLERPMVVVQGMKDRLVDPRSAGWILRHAPPGGVQVVEDTTQGHFILWERTDVVIGAIGKLGCA